MAQTSIDNYNASLAITSQCSSADPCSLVAYPGASATIGSNTPEYGLRNPQLSGQTANGWIIAGFTVTGNGSAMDLWNDNGVRIVADEMYCPLGAGEAACFHTDTLTNVEFLGNYVHNVGDQNGGIDKYYHAVYFTTNTTSVEAAWNEIDPNPTGSTTQGGCRAMQFYSTGGSDQFDLHVHDNLIYDAICDGINFSTVNPALGTVEAYNNVVFHVGTGPDPANGEANYSCIVAGTSSGATTPVEVYNNTMYDCGARENPDSGGLCLNMPIHARNNIMQQLTGETYLNPNTSSCTPLTGSNNDWYGVGNKPCSLSSDLNVSPQLVSPTTNFQLQATSPAINSGVTISSLLADYLGVLRPQGSTYDMGAYEYFSGYPYPPDHPSAEKPQHPVRS